MPFHHHYLYLWSQVKDLEVELEATEQKGKENLQQAVFIERERVTQMQWDMDELRRKCSEMESKLKLEQVWFSLKFVNVAWCYSFEFNPSILVSLLAE